MKVIPTDLPEVLILEPRVFEDERGFFLESYNRRTFNEAVGHQVDFVQDNHSRSARGVLRGLHYQLPPHAQGKLVRVTSGRVFDVAVDMRRNSPRFGRWAGLELSADNYRQLWIPPGFAHGFLVLSSSTDFLYKASQYYSPAAERTLLWNDPAIGIDWPLHSIERIVVSRKDALAPNLDAADVFDDSAMSPAN
jgi:dTDP-4-dehydrorhamnose 3,5-epimerase